MKRREGSDLTITAGKTIGLLTAIVIVLIVFATGYRLLDYGLMVRLSGIGLAGLAVAILFFLLRTLDAKRAEYNRGHEQILMRGLIGHPG
jgi:hypothetical protein